MSKKYDKFLRNRDWLYQKYWGEGFSIRKIAEEIGCCWDSVVMAFNRFNIPRRTTSESLKGDNHPLYGKCRSEKTKRKISKSLAGNTPWNKGKHHTEKTKKKMSTSWDYSKHFTEKTKQKLREARKHQPTHHTKPELIFEEICKKHNLPFKYTGNGDFWIHNINPDFVDVNGKKIAVEVFGDYWHSPLLQWDLREDRTLDYRKRILKKYGWKLIVFWESDLKRRDSEQFVLLELKKHKVF